MELLALMIAIGAFAVAIGTQRRAERLASEVAEQAMTIRRLLAGREPSDDESDAESQATQRGIETTLVVDTQAPPRAAPRARQVVRPGRPRLPPAPASPPKPAASVKPALPPETDEPPTHEAPPSPPPAVAPSRKSRVPAPDVATRTVTPTVPRRTLASPQGAADTASLESRIGGRWFHFIGVVALLFAGAYLLKHGYDQGWFSPWMQIVTGLLVGVGALVGGHMLMRRSYPVLAAGSWGGGIALLHLVLFAGHRVYGVMPREAAFGGMIATALAGIALAVWHRSLATAVLAALGAFLTPALLGGLWAAPGFLWTYLLILSAGLLVVCALREWPLLRGLAFAGVVAHVTSWWLFEGPGDRFTTVAGVSAHLVLFALEPVIGALRRRLPGEAIAAIVVPVASLLHVLAVLVALSGEHDAWRGSVILGTALFHIACAAVLSARRAGEGLRDVLGFLGSALLVAFPLAETALTGHEITLTWAVTAVVLLLLETPGGGALARRWSLVALLLAGLRLLILDAPGPFLDPVDWRPFLTTRGLTFALTFGVFAFVLATRRRRASDSTDRHGDIGGAFEHLCVTVAWIVAVSLPVALLSLEVRSAFEAWVKPHFVGREAVYEHSRAMWFSLMWIGYAGLLLIVGRRRDALLFQALGAIFGALVLVKLVMADLLVGYMAAPDPIVNARMAALAGTVLVLALVRREYRADDGAGNGLAPVCFVLGHVVVLGALSMEWHDALVRHDATGFLVGARWLGPPLLACIHGFVLLRCSERHGGGAAEMLGAVMAIGGGIAWLLLDPLFSASRSDVLLLSLRGLAGVVCAIALLVGPRLVERVSNVARAATAGALAMLGHAIGIELIALELRDLFARHPDWTPLSTVGVVAAPWTAIAGAWAVYGIVSYVVGKRWKRPHHAMVGLAVLAMSFLLATGLAITGGATLTLLANTRFLGCGAVALCLFVAAEMHRRREGPIDRTLVTSLTLVGHLLLITLLSREALDHFETAPPRVATAWLDVDDARQLSLSLIWAVYGIGMVVSGFVRRFQPVRVMALVLLAVTVLKVFLLDLSFLETPSRILSFIVLGAALVGVSYLYQRQARRDAVTQPPE